MTRASRLPLLSYSLLATVGIVLCVGTSAQAAETLRWKFSKGQSFQYEMYQNMDMQMTVQGQTFNTKTAQTMDMTWVVDSVEPDGGCQMKQTINRIRMLLEGPTGRVEYDSADEEQPNNALLNTIRPVFEALVGAEFTLKMSQLGRISDVQLPADFQASLKQNQGGQMGMFNEDSMKQMLQQAALVLPERAVSTNDSWNSEMVFEMPFGKLKSDNKMTYMGTDESSKPALEKIHLTSKTTMEPKPGSPINVDLKEQETAGTINFDNAAGRINGSAVKQKMVMSINAGGQAMEQTVTQTMRLRLKPNVKQTR